MTNYAIAVISSLIFWGFVILMKRTARKQMCRELLPSEIRRWLIIDNHHLISHRPSFEIEVLVAFLQSSTNYYTLCNRRKLIAVYIHKTPQELQNIDAILTKTNNEK